MGTPTPPQCATTGAQIGVVKQHGPMPCMGTDGSALGGSHGAGAPARPLNVPENIAKPAPGATERGGRLLGAGSLVMFGRSGGAEVSCAND
jgi:hypothetical protein